MNLKLFVLLLFFSLFLIPFPVSYALQSSDISAASAIVMVADTGEVVFEKEAHIRRPMASTTKIMTSLIALESDYKLKEVEMTENMVNIEGTSMGLLKSDRATLKTLVYGMLLQSGNDAANATALSLADTKEDFALLMNERAKKIGMLDTNFVTPSGLDSKEHYSTAYDMALLACEAIKNPEFAYICSQKSAVVYYGNPPYRRVLRNHNRLLWNYEGANGIKTGFTKKSGRCLVSSAERDNIKLVAVTLNAPNDWEDHKKMFDYGFSVLKNQKIDSNLDLVLLKIVGGEKDKIKIKPQNIPRIVSINGDNGEIKEKIYIKRFEYAPIKKGEIVGTVKYYRGNKLLCTIPLLTDENVEQHKIYSK